MARRITAFLISIVLVFSLAVISFADQTPAVFHNLMSTIQQYQYRPDNSFVATPSSDIVFDWDEFSIYALYPSPYTGFTSSSDEVLTVSVSGFTNPGLSSPPVIPFYCVRYDGSNYHVSVESIYDPATGYFSASYSSVDLLRIPFIRIQNNFLIASQCSFLSFRSYDVTVSSASDLRSYKPIQALTANSQYNGIVTLGSINDLKTQNFNPIFSEPLEKDITYLVSIGVTPTEFLSASENYNYKNFLVSGVWEGGVNTTGRAIPFSQSQVIPPSDNTYGFVMESVPGSVSGNTTTIPSFYTSKTQTLTFLYTPSSNDDNPFSFSIDSYELGNSFTGNITVQALPVVGVQLDDVQENQSFAAWLNNKFDSIFGGIAARLDGIFSKQNNAYEDAADDAVDEGLGQVEQDHQREEELTQEAISNLDEALNTVELPDLTQQQEINSGIGLLNTVIFDGFFGNPQMRFLLIFSLGMALAAVVLRLNH